jgi:hypothetical protein
VGVAGGWNVDGAKQLAADLAKAATQTQTLMTAVVEKSAADLVALTQQNASHRPGPNAPTGDYRGSWRVEPVDDGDPTAVSRSASTDRAQANRLEYGFVGADSLGREYDQDPLPHHGPAVDVIEPVFEAAMGQVADQAVRW